MMNKTRALRDPGGFGQVQGRIFEALEGLKFGTVEVQVHDGRIVRITRTEKVRRDYQTETETDRG